MSNPYAIYVNCDGAMDYDSSATGGVGFAIQFPDNVSLEPIKMSVGKYEKANIERLELQALIKAIETLYDVFEGNRPVLKSVNTVIMITDRFALQDAERTNPYAIRDWRKNHWYSHEGKPIKNEELLDRLDKARKKFCDHFSCRLSIEFKPRKYNKIADKLAKEAKALPKAKDDISLKSIKTAPRLYDGRYISSAFLKKGQSFLIHIYRKEPVKDQWEIFAEICEGEFEGRKLRIYAIDDIANNLHRRHKYIVSINEVFRFHITINEAIEEHG